MRYDLDSARSQIVRGIGEMGLPEVLLEMKLSPQSKPSRGKAAERGVDDP